jgi:hypothetical protein
LFYPMKNIALLLTVSISLLDGFIPVSCFGEPLWNISKLSEAPQYTEVPANGLDAGIRAIFFEGPNFLNRPSRVFAFVGLPKHSANSQIPGIVLAHGGGGSASAKWVAAWMARGYAAIAVDLGGYALIEGKMQRDQVSGGPTGYGAFETIDWPMKSQWTYHAVANVIRANSLLGSLQGVDSSRIGLTGISWGACVVRGHPKPATTGRGSVQNQPL